MEEQNQEQQDQNINQGGEVQNVENKEQEQFQGSPNENLQQPKIEENFIPVKDDNKKLIENNNQNDNPSLPSNETNFFSDLLTQKEKKLKSLLLNPFLSDTIITYSGKDYPCHKVVISSGSKYYYYNFLFSTTENSNGNSNFPQDKLITIPMKDNKFIFELPSRLESKFHPLPEFDTSTLDSAIQITLKFLYYNQKIKKISTEINQSNIFPLLSLAHSFDIPKLKKQLSKIIKDTVLNDTNCVRILSESLMYENENLQTECINLIKFSFDKVLKNLDEYKHLVELPYEIFLSIISSDDLRVGSEKDICDQVINYIKMRRNTENTQTQDSGNKRYENDNTNQIEENKIIDEKTEGNISNQILSNEKNINFIPESSAKNYNEFWKLHVENLKNIFIIKPLSKDQERKLIESIRFSYLSHSELLSLSIESIMNDHRDLILEGLSIRLNTYENNNISQLNLKINLTQRQYLSLSSSQMSKDKSINLNCEDDLVNHMKTSQNIKQKDMLNPNKMSQSITQSLSGPSPRPPQDMKMSYNFNNLSSPQFMRESHIAETSSLNKIVEFIYDYDFDENGVFYYLGTLGKSTIFRNPHQIGQLKIFSSSIGKGSLGDLVTRESINLRTLNEPMSYFGVDLGEDRYLVPTCYSIKNRNSSSHVMLCWILQGSNDKVNFVTLDTRIFSSNDIKVNNSLEKERSLLKSPGCTSTWGIDQKIRDKFPNGFRYFILKQVDKNSSGGYNLAISGFEIYGKGSGRWGFK
jgi:hypothetical protein